MKPNYLTKLVPLLVVMFFSIVSCKKGDTDPKPTPPPKQVIDYEQALELEKEFIDSRYEFINEVLEYKDTREYWFDLETLKQYIAYVEYESNKLGYENLGIRIYKGAYPKNSNYKDAGFSTVFLVPTGDKRPDDKGSIVSFSMSSAVNNDNINELQALNFAHGGKPPKEL